jgi:hypothetical protein
MIKLPQLAQVASNIYQEISKLSKVARIEKTLEPQGQACNGPKDRRSVPNLGGRFSLFFRKVGRRNIQYRTVAALKAPPVPKFAFGSYYNHFRPSNPKGSHSRRVAFTSHYFLQAVLQLIQDKGRTSCDGNCWYSR